MYGPHIEKESHYIEFENEQLKRKLETRRLLDAGSQNQNRPRRSLVDMFGRFVSGLDLRAVARYSPRARPSAPSWGSSGSDY